MVGEEQKLSDLDKVRHSFLALLPEQMLVMDFDDIENTEQVDIDKTLARIRGVRDENNDYIEVLKTTIANQQRMMIYVAEELDMIREVGYTHAQKNGVVMHIANRLRIWASKVSARHEVSARHQPPPASPNGDPNWVPF